MILAGDIDATNSRLAFFSERGGRLEPVAEETYASRHYANLQAIVRKFVSAHGLPVDVACFGVAGPVRDGRSEAVNLAWAVDVRELAQALPRSAVSLLNDLEAHAYGIAMLAPEDFVVLNRGAAEAAGNAAVIAAGTGLGEAGLYWDGRQHRPFAGEGGHTSFAPTDSLQVELLNFLSREFEHVSWERVLSGSGLHNIYRFLRDTDRGEEPDWLTREMQQRDAAAVISHGARGHQRPLPAGARSVRGAVLGRGWQCGVEVHGHRRSLCGWWHCAEDHPQADRLDLHGCVRGQGAPQTVTRSDPGAYHHER